MSNRLLERFGAACGILYVVLIMVGGSIGGATSSVAIILVFLALTFFLFFLGSLWAALHRAEGDSAQLSTTDFGGGLVANAVKLVGDAPLLAVRGAGEGLDPQLARSLLDTYNVSSVSTSSRLPSFWRSLPSIVTIRSGGLPRWLGWAAAVISVALIVGAAVGSANLESGWEDLPFLLFLLWTLATSIAVMWRAGATRPTEKETLVRHTASIA